MAIRPYLAMTPEEIAAASCLPSEIAWMFCPFSEDTRRWSWTVPEDAVLVLTDAAAADRSDQALSWLHNKKPKTIVLDFQKNPTPTGEAFVKALLEDPPCPVILSQTYAQGDNCPVFLDPLPLHRSLQDHLASWRDRPIWLDISSAGERITLTESGASILSVPAVEPKKKFHTDEKLHCHYAVSLEDDAAIFTLWRTQADIAVLLQEAEALGVQNAIGLHQEWQSFAP